MYHEFFYYLFASVSISCAFILQVQHFSEGTIINFEPIKFENMSWLLICFYSATRGISSLRKEKRYHLIDVFNSTSRYLDDLLNIN